ncbi:MAG: hypothetical protein U1F87_18525 [Kiritimatiellia bacterium]
MKPTNIRTLLAALCFLCAGCFDDAVESSLSSKVRIASTEPPAGKVGEPYLFRITASIKNNTSDSSYDYRFHLLGGEIPPGTKFTRSRELGNDYAEIAGTPTLAGNYRFEVSAISITLEDERREEIRNDGEPLGSSGKDAEDRKTYSILIR